MVAPDDQLQDTDAPENRWCPTSRSHSVPQLPPRRASDYDVLRVVVPYVIVTALWIYLSDDVVRRLAGDVSTSAFWSTIKGFFFIAVTAALLGILLTRRLTRLAEAQRDLARERKRLRTVLDTIPDLVWLKDADGKYVACNPAFERFVGRRESELVGEDDFAIFDRQLAESFREHDAAAVQAGRPTMNAERVTYRADGTVHDLETIKTPTPDEHGRPRRRAGHRA